MQDVVLNRQAPQTSIWEKYKKPRKPWRAPTAYELFCQSMRADLKIMHGQVSSRQINKELGTLWQSFSKDEKEYFIHEAKV